MAPGGVFRVDRETRRVLEAHATGSRASSSRSHLPKIPDRLAWYLPLSDLGSVTSP
jgi:hypothetical protein